MLAEPQLAGKVAVDIDGHGRRIRHLENVSVDDARNGAEIARNLERQRVGFLILGAGDADVDGGRLPEVQHLIDDIGRLEEERQLREAPRQFLPELGDVRGR